MTWVSPDFIRAVAAGDLGIALTGASSWLGQAFLALLSQEGGITQHTRLRLLGSAARPLRIADRVFAIEPLRDASPLDGEPWLLLHFAFLGKERTSDLNVEDFIAGNDAILVETLRIAASAKDLRIAFSSSGAAHTPDRRGNPYGWCKADHEARLTEWCGARSVPLVIPRIFAIGGPCANKVESYALSSMILTALRTGRITIQAARPTFRSYVHIDELLGVLCEAALAQVPGAPRMLDTAGARVVEMADLAATIAAAVPAPVTIERAAFDRDAPPDRYIGNSDDWRTLLVAQHRTPVALERIVADTFVDLEARFAPNGQELMQA